MRRSSFLDRVETGVVGGHADGIRSAQEALDHFIFLSTVHIRRVVTTYIRYYNGAGPS